MIFLRFLYVLAYRGIGAVATYHDTPSEQGGVVRLPVYWLHRISHEYIRPHVRILLRVQ